MAKTKASKLWLSMVIVFVVLLSVSYAEAKSLRKGEEYKEKSGEAIRIVSSDEVEIERGPDILLGKYTIDGERVRIVANVFGATLVIYYKITPDGLVEEKTGKTYYSKAALAAVLEKQRAEEKKQKEKQKEKQRFTDNGNGTVTQGTGLMWQKEDDNTERKWQSAIGYCEELSLGGYSDWRLPNIDELKSIIDTRFKEPTINTSYFPNTKSSNYWSSTTFVNDTSYAWSVNFINGNSHYHLSKTNSSGYVRCVRGGQ